MFQSRRLSAGLILLVLGLVSGCPDPSEDLNSRVPKPSKAPTATPAPDVSGGVGGGVESQGEGVPGVRFVVLQPSSLVLNVPAADGTTPAGYVASQSVSVRVALSNDHDDAKGVTWTVSDPGRLAVSAAGVVGVKAGAASGSALVTATSVTDPSKSTTAAVLITRDGMLRLSILSEDADAFTVNITQNGRFVANRSVSYASDFRLPAGTDYRVQVQPIVDAPSTPPATHVVVGIRPGEVTSTTATMSF